MTRVTPKERKRGVWWVTMGPEPHLATCQRCGGTIPKPPLPCPVRMAVAWMKAGVAEHRGCKA